jgi:hypothetical protein
MGKEANLECRVAFTGSYRDDRGSSLLNVLYDLLDKRLAGIDYFLKLDIEGSPSQAPSARQFETFIRNRLKSLPPASDPEYLSEAVDTVVWEYVIDEACKIKVSPIPKSVDAKGNPVDRPLGMFVGPVRFIQDSREIAEAIREKVGKYGALSIPFLIAVNCLGAFVEMRDVVDGLFGNVSTLVANRGGKPTVVGQRRDTERAIFDTRQGKNTVLSGVLVGRNLDPYDFPRRSLTFFPNPHAARPFSFGNEYVGSCSCGDGYIRTVEGKKLFSLFCVSEEWPMKE